VLELLKKNRDMLFNEVKLTVMIEDPREVERKRLLGIDDADTPTREDLAAVLEEVEATKKGPRKSLYAKATDTGVDPEVAAKNLTLTGIPAAEMRKRALPQR
ncbi:ycf3-interacting protein 1, chloroplastic, partial [Tanacetum coccineum]